MTDALLLVNYVYLDSEERKRFAQASHEYLIEQLQFTGAETLNVINQQFRLNFNHPCKELVWAVQFGRYITGQQFLAWNPNDFQSMIDIATKRFILACCVVYGPGTTNRVLTVSPTNSLVVGSLSAGANATVRALFISLGAQVIGPIDQTGVIPQDAQNFATTATVLSTYCGVDNVGLDDIAYANPLPLKYVSTATSVIFNGVTRSTLPASLQGNDVTVNDFTNHGLYLDRTGNPCQLAKLQLNGHDRFSAESGNYFNYVQPWECHSNTPGDGVNVYSFSLNPEDHQPSGTCNMSRIDNATLQTTFGNPDDPSNFRNDYLTADTIINIYAVNYNVLRVMSGINYHLFRIVSLIYGSITTINGKGYKVIA